MKQLVLTVLILTILILFSNCRPIEKTNSSKPNILFVVVDDLGYSDLSCTGSKLYETPNIDRLAASGISFSKGYSTCPVCSPSRASLLTGKFPARHGITDFIGAPSGEAWRKKKRFTKLLPAAYNTYLNYGDTTLAETFKQHGYKTFFAGKWHLGGKAENSLPTDHGFDVNQGGFHMGGPYTGGYFSPFNNPYLKDYPEEKGISLSMKLANETNRFIEANKDTSFFAYLCFYAVHSPIQTTEEKWRKYRNKIDSLGFEEIGFEMNRILPARKYQDNPVYAGLIEQVDDAVGSVIETLEKLNLDKNTIVVFTSDNGGVTSGDNSSTTSLAFRAGKGYQWEGGTRVPFVIKIPGKRAFVENKTSVTGADFYPTLLELAGLPLMPNQHKDGVSLVPIIEGRAIVPRPLYWHYPHYGNQGGQPHSIIQENGFKLIHFWEDDHNELYNLNADILEQEDLAARKSDLSKMMESKLLSWLGEMNALYPKKDSLFVKDLYLQVLDGYKTSLMPSLEKHRKEIMQPDWQPNSDWWGSKIEDIQ